MSDTRRTYDPNYSENIDPPHEPMGAILNEENDKVADRYGLLMAAAPDLLAACEVHYANNSGPYSLRFAAEILKDKGFPWLYQYLCEKADAEEAAIKKARGEE